jgi:glycosyltransferase involved in cell wall biosynthesis
MSTFREYTTGALQNAVYSVLRQTYPNWELIIVGDAAPDACDINNFLTKIDDNRIKFINLAQRAGTASPGTIPKIEGARRARGNLFCFLDADNLYFPDHLRRCVKAFDDDPRLDLVYGNTVIKMSNVKCPPARQLAWRAGQMSNLPRPTAALAQSKAGGHLKSQIYKKEFLNFLISQFLNLLSFRWHKPNWTPKRQKLLMRSNFLDMSEPIFTREAYFAAGGLNSSHHAADWLLWKAMIASGHNNWKLLDHLGLIYHTASLKHHLQYFGLMLMQKLGLGYHSERLKWMQGSIKRRFEKKYNSKIKMQKSKCNSKCKINAINHSAF